jgi:hypothetical protein
MECGDSSPLFLCGGAAFFFGDLAILKQGRSATKESGDESPHSMARDTMRAIRFMPF